MLRVEGLPQLEIGGRALPGNLLNTRLFPNPNQCIPGTTGAAPARGPVRRARLGAPRRSPAGTSSEAGRSRRHSTDDRRLGGAPHNPTTKRSSRSWIPAPDTSLRAPPQTHRCRARGDGSRQRTRRPGSSRARSPFRASQRASTGDEHPGACPGGTSTRRAEGSSPAWSPLASLVSNTSYDQAPSSLGVSTLRRKSTRPDQTPSSSTAW